MIFAPTLPTVKLLAAARTRTHVEPLAQRLHAGETEFAPEAVIDLLLLEGTVYESEGQYTASLNNIHRAKAIALGTNDPRQLAKALGSLAYVQLYFSDWARAIELGREALSHTADSLESINAWRAVGYAHENQQQFTQARAAFERALDLSHRFGYRWGIITNRFALIDIYQETGAYAPALASLDDLDLLTRETGSRRWNYLHMAAFVNLRIYDRERTRELLRELQPYADDSKFVALRAACQYAALALDEDEWDVAAQHLAQLQHLMRDTGDRVYEIEHARLLARLHWLRGEPARALDWADEAIAHAHRQQQSFAHGCQERIRALWQLDEHPRALAELRDALQQADALALRHDAAMLAFLQAALLLEVNPDDPATEDAFRDAERRIRTEGYGFIYERDRALAYPMLAAYARSKQAAMRRAATQALDQLAAVPPLPLRIRGLGVFEVWQSRRRVPDAELKKRRAGELLRFLLLQPNRAAHRDAVLEALWPDANPDNAIQQLHHATSTLRRTLEPELPDKFPSRYLLVEGESVRLVLPSGSQVDFEPLLAAKPESLSRDEVQTLLSRYTGDLFAQDRFADWAAAAREQLTERYIALLLMEGHAALQANQPQAALDACKRALQKDPWREDAVLLGMQAAWAMHNRPAALRLYAALEASLRDELHIQPRQDVRAFAAQLRAEA